LNKSSMYSWIARFFPDSEVVSLHELLESKCIDGTVLFDVDFVSRLKDEEIVMARKKHFKKNTSGLKSSVGCIVEPFDIIVKHSKSGVKFILADEDILKNSICEHCSIFRAKNKNLAVFLFWYLTLEEISFYIFDIIGEETDEILNMPVPKNNAFESDIFFNSIYPLVDTEQRILDNANEILDKTRMIRREYLYEFKNIKEAASK